MNIEKISERLNSINLEIKEKLSDFKNNIYPIYDGAIALETYLRSPVKIMWILKEAYDFNGTGGWNYTEKLGIQNIFEEFLEGEPHRATWDPIVYVSYGILNEFQEWREMDYIRVNTEMCQILHNIAIINTQKLPAKNDTVSYTNEISDAYKRNEDILRIQIETLNPDIIIGGNTLYLYKEMFGLDDENRIHSNSGSMSYFVTNERLFFDAYHPAQRLIKRKDYVDDIILAAKDWYNNKKSL